MPAVSNRYHELARHGSTLWHRLLEAWQQALLSCLPTFIVRPLAAKRPVLVITPTGDMAEFSRQTFGERSKIGSFTLQDLQQFKQAAKTPSLAAYTGIWIEVPEQRMLYRQIRLPAQVAKNLRQAVRFEIDRITPFSSAELFFDASINGTLAQGAKLDLLIAFCRRADVDPWLQAVTAAGGSVTKISSRHAWPGANLLPAEARPQPSRGRILATATLALLPLLLLSAVLLTPIWQMNTELTQLQHELRQSRIKLDEKEQLTERLEQARAATAEILEAKLNQPLVTNLIRQVTTLLPDTTYLLNLHYRGGRLEMRGESDNAAALIGLLENEPEFTSVTFRSPVTTAAGRENQRFHIELSVQPAETE